MLLTFSSTVELRHTTCLHPSKEIVPLIGYNMSLLGMLNRELGEDKMSTSRPLA